MCRRTRGDGFPKVAMWVVFIAIILKKSLPKKGSNDWYRHPGGALFKGIFEVSLEAQVAKKPTLCVGFFYCAEAKLSPIV